jgi:hypothetical protein
MVDPRCLVDPRCYGEHSAAHGERCNNGISHCDCTHGHHPFLLSFAFNVRPSHEFPGMHGMRARAPDAAEGSQLQ